MIDLASWLGSLGRLGVIAIIALPPQFFMARDTLHKLRILPIVSQFIAGIAIVRFFWVVRIRLLACGALFRLVTSNPTKM